MYYVITYPHDFEFLAWCFSRFLLKNPWLSEPTHRSESQGMPQRARNCGVVTQTAHHLCDWTLRIHGNKWWMEIGNHWNQSPQKVLLLIKAPNKLGAHLADTWKTLPFFSVASAIYTVDFLRSQARAPGPPSKFMAPGGRGVPAWTTWPTGTSLQEKEAFCGLVWKYAKKWKPPNLLDFHHFRTNYGNMLLGNFWVTTVFVGTNACRSPSWGHRTRPREEIHAGIWDRFLYGWVEHVVLNQKNLRWFWTTNHY